MNDVDFVLRIIDVVVIVWSVTVHQITLDVVSLSIKPHTCKIKIASTIQKDQTSDILAVFQFVKLALNMSI